jgi:hypothetical protein
MCNLDHKKKPFLSTLHLFPCFKPSSHRRVGGGGGGGKTTHILCYTSFEASRKFHSYHSFLRQEEF